MSKPITYSKDSQLLETEMYQQIEKFVRGEDGARNTQAFKVLKNVFGMPLGEQARPRKKAAKKKR